MKHALLALAFAFAAARAPAQSPEDFAKLRDEKLKKPFLTKASWFTDYDKARAESKQSGKPIFAYFTRSYST